jgi:hypothetical protein
MSCDEEFILYAMEWPMKVIICPHCATVMRLLRSEGKICFYTTIDKTS